MAESSKGASPVDSEADDNPLAAFGANEWLVDEMYEQYQRDPNSVDKVWWDFFKHNAPGGNTGGNGKGGTTSAPVTTEAKPAAKEAPKAAPQAARSRPRIPRRRPRRRPRRPPPRSRWPSRTVTPARARTPDRPRRPPSRPCRRSRRSRPQGSLRRADPDGAARRARPDRAELDASLTVPTATSVRSVPVKLLWDNRIVINNHLSRARGGKVSFTHLIGYALVKALKRCRR